MKYLVTFLLDRIAEDRAAAELAQLTAGISHSELSGRWAWALLDDHSSAFAHGAPSPARVVADCDSKRELVGLILNRMHAALGREADVEDADELRWLAAPYADHPEYEARWAP